MNSHPYRVANLKPSTRFATLRKWLFAAFASLTALGSAPDSLAQTTVTLQATRDTDIYNNSKKGSDLNYGSCNIMWVGGEKGEIDRALVGFNLTAIPTNSTITSAVLRMTRVSESESEDTSRAISVHALSQVWTEGTGDCSGTSGNVTWNNRTTGTPWTTAGGTFGAALATTNVLGLGTYDWNVTAQAQTWYANAATNNGLILKYVSESSSRYKHFASREFATASSRPQLIVTYVPICTLTTGGATTVCAGSTANVTPSTGGTWSSSNTAIATVTNAGVVTGVSGGSVTLTFTDTATGCQYTRNMSVTARPVVGGGTGGPGNSLLNYEFYDGALAGSTVDNIPTTGALSTGTVGNFAVATLQNAVDPGDTTDYSIRYTGFITISTAGTYTFFTNSDDGSKLFINEQLVVNNDGLHSPQEASGSIVLSAGVYPFRLLYFNGPGGATLSVSYQGPSIAKQAVPFSILSSVQPSSSFTLCAGSTTNVTPNSGGTWSSNNTSIATVTNSGLVTAVAAGSATLTFTDSTTGCTNTMSVTVTALPILGGATAACIGSTANVTPASGGIWSSNNTGIATVSNAGVVTGVAAGTVTLTFTNSTTGCSNTRSFTVNALPTLGGATSVCISSTANVTPSTGGTWASSNTGIATVTNAGVVTGVAFGSVTLTFTNTATGCSSTRSFTVNAPPTLGGATTVCVGATANVTPSSGGTWTSSNPAIAAVTNSGVVSGVAAGTATLTFTNTSTGCSNFRTITVNPRPTLGGATTVCIGSTANVTPATGGVWTSSNPSIASITNAGVVGGLVTGTVTLTFTDSTTGCTNTRSLTVNALPTLGGATQVAAGATANVTPSTGGTWSSSNPTVATVTNAGVVTGVAVGTATLTFTSSSTGCSATRGMNVFLVGGIGGDTDTCVGSTANVTPTGGTWVSLNPAIATVTNAGIVTGVSPGVATLEYTQFGVTQSASFTVVALPTLGGAANVCVGSVANVTPSSGGIWTSSNTAVAAINNSGQVVGLSAGTVTLTYTSLDGCSNFTSFEVRPGTAITGSASVKVGATTVQSPQTGGTWSSSNTAIATITDQGVATGVSPGAVLITFTSAVNGCSTSKVLTVIPDSFYKNISIITPGNEDDPEPENNTDPEEVDPQSWTALVVSVTNDVTGNGQGDAPLGGVQIIVRNAADNIVFTGLTGPDGLISLENLPPGFYTVTQTVPGGSYTLYANPVPVSISLGETSFANFVNSSNGGISGTIFLGFDDDVMPDVLVTLLDENGDPVLNGQGDPITTLTDEAGFYQFLNVPPGSYQVQQTVPSGFNAIEDVDGGNLTINGDNIPIVLFPASSVSFMDFVNAEPARIAGTILIDTTIDGGGDTPHVGVTVNLLNSAGSPVLDSNSLPITVITDVDGNFQFSNVPPGSYRVSQTLPTGFTAISDSDGGIFTVVGDVALIVVALGDVGVANFINQPQTDMEVTKTISNPTPAFGSQVTFTITATNNGPNSVTAAKVEEIGTGLIYVSHNTAKGTFTLEPGAPVDTLLGTWNVGTLASGQSATLTIVATVSGDSSITAYNNKVIISSEMGDTDPTNNEFDVPFTPPSGSIRGRVRIDTTGDKVFNSPQPGVTVTLLDELGNPVLNGVGVPITSITDSTGLFIFENLPPGTYQVSQTVPTGFIAVADTDGGNLTRIGDVTPIVLGPGIDIANRNFVNSQLGSIAGNVSKDLTGDTNGNAPLSGIVVILRNNLGQIVLDPNGDIISTITDVLGNYQFANVPAGQYQVAITVPSGLVVVKDIDGGNLSINGDVILRTVIPAQNLTGQDFVLSELADLSITKAVNNATPNVGSNVTFTITANNAGPAIATGVSVSEQLPSGYTLVSATPSVGTYSAVNGTWTIGTMAVNTPATLTVVATVLPTGDYRNVVVITGEQDDPNPPNNEDEETPEPNPLADLAIVKSVSNSTPNVGEDVTFTLLATNHGPSDATGVAVTELLSSGYTFVSATASVGSYNEVTGLWTIGNLANQASATLTITVEVLPTGDYTNAVAITGNEDDPNPPNNEDEETPEPNPLADLAIVKSVSNSTPNVGDNITFTLLATNNGPSDATGVFVNEPLLAGYTFVSATPSVGTYSQGTGVWTIGNLANAATATLDIVVTVNPTGPYTNIAAITGNEDDPNPPNNEDEETPDPNPLADLAIVKSVSNSTPSVGSNVTFTLLATNNGPSDATGVFVNEPLLAGYTFVSATPSVGSYSQGTGVWTIGNLANAATATLEIVVTVNPTGPYTNAVVIVGDQDDPNPPNNEDEETPNPQSGGISGTVLADTTGNGTGDTPLPNVTVTLLDDNGDPVTTTTTDSNGNYSFPNVPPGDYTVVETDPPGYSSLTPNNVPVTLLPGESKNVDFTDTQNGTISGTVLADTTGNGTGDTPLPNVTVTLLNENGDPVTTTTTDTNGNYSFPNVPPGDYTVVETDPIGYSSLTPNSVPVTLLPGETEDVDFTDTQNGTISGTVLADTTGNGTGDTPLPNVTVTLLDENGDPVTTTTTDTNGNYSFPNVPPGDYTVVETDPPGYSSLTPNSVPVTLIPGETEDVDFTDTQNGTISGTVLADTTGNGTGDTPLVGVTIRLLDENGDQVTSTSTDSSGNYSFPNVPPGVYTVVETDPIGYISLTPNSVPITLLPGEIEVVNFVDTQPGSVTGTVLADTTGNNLGDTPLVGVTLTLFDATNEPLATTTTNGSGGYSFPDLPPGVYTVVQTLPSGYTAITPVSVTDSVLPGAPTTINFVDRAPPCVVWEQNYTDTDGDVFPLIQEYAFGGDPTKGDHLVANTSRRAGLVLTKNLSGGLDVTVVRPAGREDVTYTLVGSADLVLWTELTALPTVTANGDSTDTLTWANVQTLAPMTPDRGFVRLKVETTCNPGGSYTLVQGWCEETVAGARQTHGVNFTSLPVYTGRVDTISGNSVTLQTSAPGVNLSSFLVAPDSYYLELTDGPAEGHRFDITSGAVASLTLNLSSAHNTLATVPTGIDGSHFVIRKHFTLAGVYPPALYRKSSTVGSADQVQIYNGIGFDTYFSFSAGYWVKQGDGIGNRNNFVIAPGVASYVVHPNSADSHVILQLGEVRYNDFIRPLPLGSTGLSFVAQGYPLDATPFGLDMKVTNGFTASSSVGSASIIQNWIGDTTVNTAGYTTNFMLSGGTWRTQGNVTNNTSDSFLFKHCRGVFIGVKVNKLNWTHSLPWNPLPWVQPLD